jgi:hypothetical protein
VPRSVVPGRDDDDLALDALPADERHRRGAEERAGFRGDGVEHLRLRPAGGDEHRDAPQSRLLGDQLCRLAARFGVDDRLRDQGREVAEPVLGAGRKRPVDLGP